MIEPNAAVKAGMSRLPVNFAGFIAKEANPWSDGVEYRLVCTCGAEFVHLRATATPHGETSYLDPISTHCESCGSTTTIFDSSRDGYDGQLNGGGCYEQGNDLGLVECPICGDGLSTVHCILAYNTDFEEEGFVEGLAIAPDLFDWIAISTTCRKGHEQEIGGWEMA